MKKLISILILLCISIFAFTQGVSKKFTKNKALKTKEIFYTKGINPLLKHGEYSLKVNGVIRLKGNYIEDKREGEWLFQHGLMQIKGKYIHGKKEGRWIYTSKTDTLCVLNFNNGEKEGTQLGYYENGQLASTVNYNAGKLNGYIEYYHKNGTLKETCNYKDGLKHGERVLYQQDGLVLYRFIYHNDLPVHFELINENTEGITYEGEIKEGTGYLNLFMIKEDKTKTLLLERNFKDSLNSGEIHGYISNGKHWYTGQFENGFIVGNWRFFKFDGTLKEEKTYKIEDKLTSDTSEYVTKNFGYPFFVVEKMPEYPGGDLELRKAIAHTVVYPESCKEQGIQGRVFVQFVVNHTGEIEEVKSVKKVHPLLEEAAVKVINDLPPWKPGFQHGLPVKVSFTVPINYNLN